MALLLGLHHPLDASLQIPLGIGKARSFSQIDLEAGQHSFAIFASHKFAERNPFAFNSCNERFHFEDRIPRSAFISS